MPTQFNWLDLSDQEDQQQRKKRENDWLQYAWAGENQLRAKLLGLARDPVYITQEDERRALDYERATQQTPQRRVFDEEPGVQRIGSLSASDQRRWDELTPGERLAQRMSYAMQTGVGGILTGARLLPESQKGGGFVGEVTDFARAAAMAPGQTIADIGGAIADFVTGNTGRNQNYNIYGNRPQDYSNYGGVGQTLGSIAPDIGLAIATFGGTAAASTAMAGSKIPALARLGRMAVGSAEAAPTAITAFGRAITPAATRLTRVAATTAAALPTALNVAPEVVAGRMSPVEGVAMTGMAGLGGTLAAGTWGGSRLANFLSDMGVNMATQAGSEAVTLLPGGAEFDAAQAWKNMLYGAGLGAAFGVMNAAPMQGEGQRAVLGQRPVEGPAPTPVEPTVTGTMAKPVQIARETERMLFGGEPTLAETATPEQANLAFQQMRKRPMADYATLRPNEAGDITSLSDAYLRGETEQAYPGVSKSAIANAADMERKTYAASLATEFQGNPDVLVKLLDLEVQPGEITPQNAKQVLASKIENEWLNQAANGKGLAAVEGMLRQAGLRQGPQAAAPAPETGIAPIAEAPPQEAPTTGLVAPVQGVELPSEGYLPYSPSGFETARAVREAGIPVGPRAELPAAPESTAPLAGPMELPPVAPEVQQAIDQATAVSDLTGIPVEEILPKDSDAYQAYSQQRLLPEAAPMEPQAQESIAPTEAQRTQAEQLPMEFEQKAKRKRIARTIARNDAEASILDSISEAVPDKVSVSETAVASIDPRDAVPNKIGQQIATWTERLSSQATELDRSRGRRAAADLTKLAEMLRGDGAEIKIAPPTQGSRYSMFEEFVAELSDLTPRELRTAVRDGQTLFAGDNIEIKPVTTEGAKNTYTVNFLNKNMLGVIEDSFLSARETAAPTVKQKAVESEQIRTTSDRIYGTSEEIRAIFDDETSPDAIFREGPDIAMESPAAMMESTGHDPSLDAPMFTDEAASIEEIKSSWRGNFSRALASATKYVSDQLRANGSMDQLGIKEKDVRSYLISVLAPNDWQKMGELYLSRTMKPNLREQMSEAVNTVIGAAESRKGGSAYKRNPLQTLAEVSANVPDAYFDRAYDNYVPKFVEAQEHAATIAEKAGIEDVRDVWRYLEWQNAGKRPRDKQTLMERWARRNTEPVEFSNDKATDIGRKIDGIVNTDGDVYYAYDRLKSYVVEDKGAQAFQEILDYNLLGNPKNPRMNLRNIPYIRNAALFPALYALDSYVEKLEDDETYMGIPGKVIKNFLGDGETMTYAAAGLFGVGMKVTNKPGQAKGYRARMGDAARKMIDSSRKMISSDNRSVARMAPEMQSKLGDEYMALTYPTIKPETPAYQAKKSEWLRAQYEADLSGGRVIDVFNKLRETSTAGTVGIMTKFFADINNLGMRSQFVKEYIVDASVNQQTKIRQLSKQVEEPINAVLPGLVSKYKRTPEFWDALWAMDYRMSGLELSSKDVSAEVATLAREEVENEIKREFFSKKGAGDVYQLDERTWGDFMAFQNALNSLRKEHLRALVSKSMGINSWGIESHYGELKIRKDATLEAHGSAREAAELAKQRLDGYVSQYNAIVKAQGREAANQAIPGYKEIRKDLRKAYAEADGTLRQFAMELEGIQNRMDKIRDLDAMVEKSTSNRYLYRHRDGKAPFVLRLEFNKDTGLPSVRREYTNIRDAELGRAEYLREAVKKRIESQGGYEKLVDARKKLQDELEELTSLDEVTPQSDKRIRAINAELDKLDGLKPVTEMTDAEVFRFARTYDMLGAQQTIRDMRGRLAIRRGTATANMIIDQIMSASDPIRAQIITRTVDQGSISPRYIDGKGNASLVDSNNGDVMMFAEKDAPTVDDMVEAIIGRVDEPVDRAQLRELIEREYTYRDKTIGNGGKEVETVWIDMAAMRKAVSAYLDPYIPNLLKRNNFIGYYNPDGTWDTKKKIDYTVESIETMLGQIRSYNQQTALRRSISEATDWLNKYDINNGLREYVVGMTHYNEPIFNEDVIKTLAEYEGATSRMISMGTLFANVGSAIGNRLQGIATSFANGMQNAVTRYGVRKVNTDGTEGQIEWLPSQAAADAYVYSKQQEGDPSWRTVEGMKWKGLFNAKTYGYGVAASVAPGITLKYLAKLDGYGVKPKSEYGYWAMIYDQQRLANLEQGGVTGNYAIREGIKTGMLEQKAEVAATAITSYVERANNFGSILWAGATSETKFGLTSTDWGALNAGQRSDVVNQALIPYQEQIKVNSAARELIQQEIATLQKEMETATPTERISMQKRLDMKVDKLSRTKNERDILVDQLTDYLVYNRGLEQGNWDPISKAKFERMILAAPGGRLAMTMTAPILRSMNAWSGMARRAGATQGGKIDKLGRAAAPLMGASILTTLLGGAASMAMAPGGIFLADIANIAEYLYAQLSNEEGDKLDNVAPRQMWEKIAEDMAPKYGVKPEDARNFVRAFWSEGLIRYHYDVNISSGAGVYDLTTGGTPAQTVISVGKAGYKAAEDIVNAFGGTATPYDFMWSISSALPTSAKRLTQTGLNLIPASAGGQGAVKLDRDGNPIIDQFTGQPQVLSGWDLTRQTILGKPWKDTRSMLVTREGGTPLYTANDRAAWANHLIATPYVRFGTTGKNEVGNAAFFERNAEELQKAITAKYDTYRKMVEDGRNTILDIYRKNERVRLSNGESRTFREILAETATSGIIPETELKGRGAESVRDKLLTLADTWGRSRAAAEAVQEYYGGNVSVVITDDLLSEPSADEFALNKLRKLYKEAYKRGNIRRRFRTAP